MKSILLLAFTFLSGSLASAQINYTGNYSGSLLTEVHFGDLEVCQMDQAMVSVEKRGEGVLRLAIKEVDSSGECAERLIEADLTETSRTGIYDMKFSSRSGRIQAASGAIMTRKDVVEFSAWTKDSGGNFDGQRRFKIMVKENSVVYQHEFDAPGGFHFYSSKGILTRK